MKPAPRVAFVTGASRGIGRVVATHLAEAGYRVAVAARSEDELATLARETGVLAVPLDVTDGGAVDAAFARIDDELGPLDLLVANAGTAGDPRASWEQRPKTGGGSSRSTCSAPICAHARRCSACEAAAGVAS